MGNVLWQPPNFLPWVRRQALEEGSRRLAWFVSGQASPLWSMQLPPPTPTSLWAQEVGAALPVRDYSSLNTSFLSGGTGRHRAFRHFCCHSPVTVFFHFLSHFQSGPQLLARDLYDGLRKKKDENQNTATWEA